MKMDCGCNAHIVRLPQNQQFTNFDPPGVDFLNCLIFNETNNVCVAPYMCKIYLSKSKIKFTFVRIITNSGYYEKKKNPSSAQISDYWLGHVFLSLYVVAIYCIQI